MNVESPAIHWDWWHYIPQLLYQILYVFFSLLNARQSAQKRLINEAHFISNPTIPKEYNNVQQYMYVYSQEEEEEDEKIYIKACLFFSPFISAIFIWEKSAQWNILYDIKANKKAFTCSTKKFISYYIFFSSSSCSSICCLYIIRR